MKYFYPNKDLGIVSVEATSFEVKGDTLYVDTVEGLKTFHFARSTVPSKSRKDNYTRHSFFNMWGLCSWINVPNE